MEIGLVCFVFCYFILELSFDVIVLTKLVVGKCVS